LEPSSRIPACEWRKGFVGVTTPRPKRQNTLDVSNKETEGSPIPLPPVEAVSDSLCLVEQPLPSCLTALPDTAKEDRRAIPGTVPALAGERGAVRFNGHL